MPQPDHERARAVAATWNLAAGNQGDPVEMLWRVAAAGTLEAAGLRPGETVLDVCCGSGSTAVPAAQAVAPDGHVTGVDLSEGMVDEARNRQSQAGVTNAVFERGDMLHLAYDAESFDVVMCQLGIFFVPDTQAAVEALWRPVRRGGRLVLATFLGRPMEPATSAFSDALRAETGRSGPAGGTHRTDDTESMRQLMLDAGTAEPEFILRNNTLPLGNIEDFWTIIMGGGMRSVLDQLDADAVARIREHLMSWLAANDVRELDWNLIYTVATKA